MVTTATLNLMQNSFSRRGWFEPRPDLYKGNGRVRHERLVLQVGTLLSVHVHSYQSHEAHQPDPPPPPEGSELTRRLLSKVGLAPSSRGITPGYGGGGYGPGHDEHFDVTVYRNVAAVGGPAIEHLPIGLMVNEQQKKKAGYLGHNEHGRERILADWLEGGGRADGLSPLRRQRPTMYLLSRMYEMLALNRASLHTLEPEGEEAQAARRPAAGVPIGRRYSAPSMVFSVNENDSQDTTRLQPVPESPRRENTIS